MEFEEIKFIDKEIVHKTNKENVHIYNLRRELPRNIEYSVFEQLILPGISQEEKVFLSKYYKKSKLHYDEESGTGFYVLRDIPYSIDKEKAELYLADSGVSDDEKKTILSFYKYDETFQLYNLIEEISEEDVVRLQNIMGKRNIQISDGTRRQLSEILEKVKGWDNENREIYNANMYIDQNHSYFFEHPNEHVPGMMMIETARQLLVGCCHVFGKVPKDSSFMLLHMDLKFQRYVELNFPVRIHVEMNKLNKSKLTGAWSYLVSNVTFYQKHQEVSKMVFEASIVGRSVFEKIREEKNISGQLPRFWPLTNTPKNNIAIRDNKDENRYLCYLMDISISGFLLRFNEDSFMLKSENENIDELDDYKFHIYFEVSGFINGKCKIRWVRKDIDSYVVGFEIVEISDLDRKNLNDAIKRHFFVREDREIL